MSRSPRARSGPGPSGSPSSGRRNERGRGSWPRRPCCTSTVTISRGASPPGSGACGASEKKGRPIMPATVRFDPSAPYEVEEADVVYAKPDGQKLLARVYGPKGKPDTPLVGLVDVHGGAWNRGDRNVGAHHGRGLAAAGLVVASLDFRQGPTHQHPAGCVDIAAGVRWMRANAGHLGVDPTRLGLVGQSSGGHLALLVALQPRTPPHI